MGLVKATDTAPGRLVRAPIHKLGYRFRVHDARLPGCPDPVFFGRRKAIFGHGCFWHRHAQCHFARISKSRLDFWQPKLDRNKARNAVTRRALTRMGGSTRVVWECELRDPVRIMSRSLAFLEDWFMSLSSIELFAGAGGLAMGISLAGFRSHAVVEWDKWACDTVRENQRLGSPLVRDWPLVEGDVRHWIENFDSKGLEGKLDLVAGGPPCQPFSMGGKHQAHRDERDMFPTTVDVIRRLKPRAFVVENVKGLTRSSFHNYYQYILTQLQFPQLNRKPDESWADHDRRLQQFKTSKCAESISLRYNVVPTLVNAANFGVPQRRERVFIVGFRSDVSAQWAFPRESHSLDAMLHDQWVTGEYWERHRIATRKRPAVPEGFASLVARLRGLGLPPTRQSWMTVRDALVGLTDPEINEGDALNHRFQSGAKSYPGHTGSPLDLPAKTLKAGDHGVPGGENMMVRDDGSRRYFSVRESARLQTFPDGYAFHGSWTEAMRQLGNAVPVTLGNAVAASVAEHLLNEDVRNASLRRLPMNGVMSPA